MNNFMAEGDKQRGQTMLRASPQVYNANGGSTLRVFVSMCTVTISSHPMQVYQLIRIALLYTITKQKTGGLLNNLIKAYERTHAK